jgi:hypothetical protein
MIEVSKQQFKEMYFDYGRGLDGWTKEYWDIFFENEKPQPMKYLAQKPSSPLHTRMMIVSDHHINEYRMFFLTEDEEEYFFR